MNNRYKSTPSVTLSDLKKENRILRSEIKRLNRTLRAYSSSQSKFKKIDGDQPMQMFFAKASESLTLGASSYPRYLTARISRASVVGLWRRASGYLRKFRLLSTVMRTVYSVAAIIGTGAFFIFLSGAVLFIIPISFLFCAAIYVSSMLLRKKAFKKLSLFIKDRDIYVVFASRGRPFEKDSCFMNTADMLSKIGGYVIIVSPYFVSSKGFGEDVFYPVVRFETNNVCLVRKYAFFALRSRLLSGKNQRVTYIY